MVICRHLGTHHDVVITMSGNYVLDILSFFFTFLYIDELYSLDELIPMIPQYIRQTHYEDI